MFLLHIKDQGQQIAGNREPKASLLLKLMYLFASIDDSPYYVFVALCIVVIVVSLIKIAASNENIEYFREYFAVGYRAPDPSFF